MKITSMPKEDINAEINRLGSRIKDLKRELQRRKKESVVPKTLYWNIMETYYSISPFSNEITDDCYYYNKDCKNGAENHTIFKTEKYAEMFRERMLFVADLLHFKWFYDRDYKPDWNNDSKKYYVFYSLYTKTFKAGLDYNVELKEAVYFSSKDIAQKCADWLNDRNYGKDGE